MGKNTILVDNVMVDNAGIVELHPNAPINGLPDDIGLMHDKSFESSEELSEASLEGTLITFTNEDNAARDGSNIGNDTRTDSQAEDAFTGTKKYRGITKPKAPTNYSVGTVVVRDDQSISAPLTWAKPNDNIDGYTLRYAVGDNSSVVIDANSPTIKLSADATGYVIEGVSEGKYIKTSLKSYVVTNKGLYYSTAVTADIDRTANNVEFGEATLPDKVLVRDPGTGDIQDLNATPNKPAVSALSDGQTVTDNAADGKTAHTDTTQFRGDVAPTNVPVYASISSVTMDDGSALVTITWTYDNTGTNKAHGFLVYYSHGKTSGQVVNTNSNSKKAGSVERKAEFVIPANNYVTLGVAAYYSSKTKTTPTAITTDANWTDHRPASLVNLGSSAQIGGVQIENTTDSQSKVDARLSSTEKTRLNAGMSPDNAKNLENADITINADGTLGGAGGGQVTTSGIGAETPTGAQSKVDSRLSATEKTNLDDGKTPDGVEELRNSQVTVNDGELDDVFDKEGQQYQIKPSLGVQGNRQTIQQIHDQQYQSHSELEEASVEGTLITFAQEQNSAREGSNLGSVPKKTDLGDVDIGGGKTLKDVVEVRPPKADSPLSRKAGLKTGAAIGDAVEQNIIWSDVSIARTSNDYADPVDPILETLTSYTDKVSIPYIHNKNDVTILLNCRLRSTSGDGVYVKLQIMEMLSSGQYGTVRGSVEDSTTTTGWYMSKTLTLNAIDIGLLDGITYWIAIYVKAVSGDTVKLNASIIYVKGN